MGWSGVAVVLVAPSFGIAVHLLPLIVVKKAPSGRFGLDMLANYTCVIRCWCLCCRVSSRRKVVCS